MVTDRDETPKIEAEEERDDLVREENSSKQVLDDIDDLLEDLDRTPEVTGDPETPRGEEKSYQEFVADIQQENKEQQEQEQDGKTDGDIEDLSESKIDQMLELSLSDSVSESTEDVVTEDLLNAREETEVQPGASENKPDDVTDSETVDVESEPRKESVALSDRSETVEDNVEVDSSPKEVTPVNEDPQAQPPAEDENSRGEIFAPSQPPVQSENSKECFSESESLPPPPQETEELRREDFQTFPDPPEEFPDPPPQTLEILELVEVTNEDQSLPEPPSESLEITKLDQSLPPPPTESVEITKGDVSLPLPPPESDLEQMVREDPTSEPSPVPASPSSSVSSVLLPSGRVAVTPRKPTAVVKPCYQEETAGPADTESENTDNSRAPPAISEEYEKDPSDAVRLNQAESEPELVKLDKLSEQNLFQAKSSLGSQTDISTELTVTETPPVPDLSTEEPRKMAEDEEEIIPPAKGYNLDFLDNLDDPNFNPFETKTAVTDCFSESAPVTQAAAQSAQTGAKPERPEPSETTTKPEVKPPVKKALPKKPWLKAKKKPTAPSPAEKIPAADTEKAEEEEEVKVPGKGYNLDFLDNLDDPNFNPFETKTAVIDKFEDSAPVNSSQEAPVVETEVKEEVKEVPVAADKPKEVKKKPAKTLPPKPWLKKKASKPVVEEVKTETEEEVADEVKVPSKGYNLDFLDNLDDPNFNPFETKTAVVEKFEDSGLPAEPKVPEVSKQEPKVETEEIKEVKEEVKKPKKEMPTKPWLKKGKKKTEEPVKVEEEEDEEPKAPSKGYNLDFLDNLEDPNFDPFTTKSSVSNVDEPPVRSEESAGPDLVPEAETLAQIVPATLPEEEEEAVKPPGRGYNLDFLDSLEDPNFNPFETKSGISNKEPECSPPPLEEVTEDFPPPPPEELGSDSESFKLPAVIAARSKVSLLVHHAVFSQCFYFSGKHARLRED